MVIHSVIDKLLDENSKIYGYCIDNISSNELFNKNDYYI